MAERKTFSSLKKGDIVTVIHGSSKPTNHKVRALTKNKYMTTVELPRRQTFALDNESARLLTEYYNRRNQAVYIIKQPSAAQDSAK